MATTNPVPRAAPSRSPFAPRRSTGSRVPLPGTVVRFRVVRGAESGTVLTDTIAVAAFDGTASVDSSSEAPWIHPIVEAFLPDEPSAIARFRAMATPPPRLASVVPSSFAAGDTVRLRGQFFNASASGNTAFFGSARARVVRADADTSLTVVVPPCVSAGAVSARVVVGSVATNTVAATFAGPSGLLSLRSRWRASRLLAPSSRAVHSAARRWRVVPPRAAIGGVVGWVRQVDFALCRQSGTASLGDAAARSPHARRRTSRNRLSARSPLRLRTPSA